VIVRLKRTPKDSKETQYHNSNLNSNPPNTTQEYTRPGQSVVQHLYHQPISSAIRVTQIHDSVSIGWHSTLILTLNIRWSVGCAPNYCSFCRNAITASSTQLHHLFWFKQYQFIAKLSDLKIKTWPRTLWQEPKASDSACTQTDISGLWHWVEAY